MSKHASHEKSGRPRLADRPAGHGAARPARAGAGRLRIIWELREDRALTSRALRTACDEASPTILQARLTELREAGFVELGPATAIG